MLFLCQKFKISFRIPFQAYLMGVPEGKKKNRYQLFCDHQREVFSPQAEQKFKDYLKATNTFYGLGLDLEALEAVAGGETSSDDPALLDEYGHSQWCVVAWHCFTAAIHTQSEEKKLACWSDYRCISVNMGGLIEC